MTLDLNFNEEFYDKFEISQTFSKENVEEPIVSELQATEEEALWSETSERNKWQKFIFLILETFQELYFSRTIIQFCVRLNYEDDIWFWNLESCDKNNSLPVYSITSVT